MKGPSLRTVSLVLLVIIPCFQTGCKTPVQIPPPQEGAELLTVDFKEGQTLRYKFSSNRKVTLNWGTTKTRRGSQEEMIEESTGSAEFVVAYEPVEVNPFGISTIKATCESSKVKRSTSKARRYSRDAAEALAGKTFTFTVQPTGRMEDRSQLEAVIKVAGERAFRSDARQGRIKEPDMIDDFTTTQWFLWDAVSSLEKPLQGVTVGQSWKSQLPVPNSMVLKKARNVTYTLKQIRASNKGRLAVIHSSYSAAESLDRHWPMPYTGRFGLSGPFGFLRMFARAFTIVGLKGQGEELFNIDAGRIERYNQKYRVEIEAGPLPLPGGAIPKITIDQTLSMQLVGS
jgi:hypothetical protein